MANGKIPPTLSLPHPTPSHRLKVLRNDQSVDDMASIIVWDEMAALLCQASFESM